MNMTLLIAKKRDGGELSSAEVEFVVGAYTEGLIPDSQMAALLMAIVWRGMSDRELLVWCNEMLGSGISMDLSSIKGPKVDKHSTGGVGDKCSLICAPVAAACGVYVPMMAGRSLGHTGGTIDKLESIPGFSADLSPAEFKKTVRRCGMSIISQTGKMAPADGRIYALRDHTATIESIPLIAASIMSKKLAEGISALVMDIKVGLGAFMKDAASAAKLAGRMEAIGKAAGCAVDTLLTRMDQPLGAHVGNSLEVVESIEILKGKVWNDCAGLSLELAARMIVAGGIERHMARARKVAEGALKSGAALKVFRAFVDAQGGDPRVVDDYSIFPSSGRTISMYAASTGWVNAVDAMDVGLAALALRGGRRKFDSRVDHGAGIVLHRKVGDRVVLGEPLCTFHFDNRKGIAETIRWTTERLCEAYVIGGRRAVPQQLVMGRR
ncbi:MAG: thymidine phosphorylase [Myxococcota bacterium]|jgi:pyrimidine-nucleoside phosphorylase